jgi:two-component system chemotaxis sensor kinase CheA
MNQNDETLEYIHGFVEEGREMLDSAEPNFIDLEKSADDGAIDMEMVNRLFRMFHTFKGVSSFLNLDVITKVTHSAESFLDKVRSSVIELSHDHIDLLMETGDFLREALDVLDGEFSDESLKNDSTSYIERFDQLLGTKSTETSEKAPSPEVPVLSEEPKVEIAEAKEEVQQEENELEHDQELLEQFLIESEEILNKIEEDLISFEQDTSNLEKFNSVFRNFHSFKGNCGFFGFQDLEKVCHKCETIFDYLRANPAGFDQSINSNFLSVVSIIKEALENIKHKGQGKIPSNDTLVSILNDLFALIQSGNIDSEQSEIYSQIVESMVDMISHDNDMQFMDDDAEDKKKDKEKKREARQKALKSASAQTIRVDTNKLDVLLNLVGELVVSQSMIANSPDVIEQADNLPILSKRIDELKKISRDIQEASMAMRMVPIEPMFKKMIRLVRDVSVKSKKEVNLILRGGETEVDKNLIENLGDPLVHILRNAVDHGIEFPEERKSLGKNREGTIVLEAMHANGEVWIKISDDGRGLDRDKILSKAIEKGLAEDGVEYDNNEVFNLIFAPGFSTASAITNISGRGVGMDVVRTQLKAMKGNVNIQSEPGKGSVFTLRIPLTMAILDGMIVKVDNRFYALPVSSIQESFQMDGITITTMVDGSEMVKVRDQFIPVFRLSEFYNTGNGRNNEGILMILAHDEEQICVFVDEIVGQQQIVLKPMPLFIGSVKCISGCAILSGGKLSMVLDARELISHAH